MGFDFPTLEFPNSVSSFDTARPSLVATSHRQQAGIALPAHQAHSPEKPTCKALPPFPCAVYSRSLL